ncbi:MAG: phosphoglycerate kinase [Candidatus Aenigmarchaeota archaeon]|nr:phosphoglycerate kinase [Candidatus Aenigmarchaeota archaeon]
MKEFFVLDDFDFDNKTVAARIDLNSHFSDGKLLDNERFKAHSETIKYLMEKNAKIVLLAHQGRRGEEDFTSLEQHAKLLEKYIGQEVKFAEKIIDEKTREMIKNLKPGEVLLLNNVRYLLDEVLKSDPRFHLKSSLVQFLSPLIDFYVLDAFSVSHRAHSSIVGFALVKPMIAGKVMEKEIESKKEALKPLGINTWVLGGAKIDDCIKVMEFVLNNKPESVERILTGGVLANLFLLADGYEIGFGSRKFLDRKGYFGLLERAKNLLDFFRKEIILPKDVAIEKNGERVEVDVNEVPWEATILDIGERTIEHYSEIIEGSRTVILKGPLGVYERKGFEKGTKKILNCIGHADVYSLIGGGDTSLALKVLGIDKSLFSHVSIGGGALITFLSGEKMPGIEALKLSYQKFKKQFLPFQH